MHHVSIRTADIHRAIAFYGHLGFEVQERFTTGYTLACWLVGQTPGLEGRIELIQIPEPQPAPDAFGDEHYVGYYHLSFDLTDQPLSLPDWLGALKQRISAESEIPLHQTSELRVLLEPHQQMIGNSVYEVMFLADCDGLPLEFIRALGKSP
jgi:catechol 2,3-dioxygenase-like lactoylglutathione lyase family enzyme